jgi:TP901 family phage tail tape measure protein
MAGRRTSVIQVMITGDSSDLQKSTKRGASAFDILAGAAIVATKVIATSAATIAGISIREFAKFDDAMTKSTAIMGDLSDSLRKDMSDAARQVALTTTFAADQAAEAFFFLASAGLSAEQSIAALPQVSRFAQAGAFDLARATDLLTDAQSALGLTSADAAENLKELTRLSDVLVGANTLANASVEQFSAALTNKAGAALRIMNKEVEEGVAALALLADRGIKGTEAGEKLSIMLRDVTRAAARSPKEFEKLGLSVLDANGNLRNIADVTEEFTRVLGGMSDAQAASTLESLGLTRSVGDVIRTMFGGADQIRAYEDALKSMGGMTDEVAEKQLQSFNAQLSLMRSGMSDVAISIGEALAGPLGKLVAWFRGQIPAIKEFVEQSIPQVEAFVDRAVAKFFEFKTKFDENLKQPLIDFKNVLVGFADIGRIELETLLERLKGFFADFRTAIDDADPEEAGRLLGEFIANTFRQAFARAEIVGDAIKQWADSEDWGEIGKKIGELAIPFVKGFFEGMTSQPEDSNGVFRTIAKMLSDNFVSILIGAFVLKRVPLVGGIFKAILLPITLALRGVGIAVAAKTTPLLGSVLLGALWGTIKFVASVLGLLLRGAGGLFTTFIAVPLANGIRAAIAFLPGLIAPAWQTLLISVRGAFRTWAFRFTGVAGATITRAIGLLAVAGIKALAKAVAAFAVAIFGWPLVLVAAIVAAFTVFILRFRNWFNNQEDEFSSLGGAILEFIFQGIRKLDKWFKDNVIAVFNEKFLDFAIWFANQVDRVRAWGSGIIEGIIGGIKQKASDLKDALVNAAKDAWDATKRFLGIKSPSTLFAGIGQNMMEGMAKGIDASGSVIQASVGVNSAMAASEARKFTEMAAERRVSAQRALGGTNIVNVTGGMMDPQGVADAVVRVLNDANRRTGAGGAAVFL